MGLEIFIAHNINNKFLEFPYYNGYLNFINMSAEFLLLLKTEFFIPLSLHIFVIFL